MKRIKLELSVDSIESALKELQEYKKEKLNDVKKLVKMMCEEGETYAIMHLAHVDTGETMASIKAAYRSANEGIIIAGGNAVWIEFGTGVYKNGGDSAVGKYVHPSGDKFAKDGIVPIGTYGKGFGSRMEGWYYEDPPLSGEYHFTRGIESNPFMWETAQYLRKNLKRFAKEAFNDSDK